MPKILVPKILLPLTGLVLWVLMCELKVLHIFPSTTTTTRLSTDDSIVQKYIQNSGGTPHAVNDLRFFARQSSTHFASYDAWGARIDYQRLSPIFYALRSYGESGNQNSWNQDENLAIFRGDTIPDHGLIFRAGSDESIGLRPPVVFFAGADDGSGRRYGEIIPDSVTGQRVLIIRDRQRQNFFMRAPHDRVEEFLWIPDQDKVIFTAAHSARYHDGVFLWDLVRDDVVNLLDLTQSDHRLAMNSKQPRFYLALAGIHNASPLSVSFYAKPATSAELDPREFFLPTNRWVVTLGDQLAVIRPTSEELSPSSEDLSLEFLAAGGGKQSLSAGTQAQTLWRQLPRGGDSLAMIDAWQNFVSTYNQSVLTPYGVWGVSIFYHDAAMKAGPLDPKSKILSGYSIELARGISQMPTAPSYVRAIGTWMSHHN